MKAKHQRLKSGAGRPGPASTWHLLSMGRSWSPLGVGSSGGLINRPHIGPSGLLGSGRPTSGSLSVLRCTIMLLSDHGSILDRVYVAYLIMAQVGFSFEYGSKPSGSKLCISGFSPLKWLGFSLYVTLVKFHTKILSKLCRSAGFGPSGLNSVRFGSNLDMLFLKSNKHQNLWNSLVIMVMAWLGPIFHEIRRSVGGENLRYRPL